jgi:hypothetical protein
MILDHGTQNLNFDIQINQYHKSQTQISTKQLLVYI